MVYSEPGPRSVKTIHTVFELLESAGLDIELSLQVGVCPSIPPIGFARGKRGNGTTGLGVVEGDIGSDRERGYEGVALLVIGAGGGQLGVMRHQRRGGK